MRILNKTNKMTRATIVYIITRKSLDIANDKTRIDASTFMLHWWRARKLCISQRWIVRSWGSLDEDCLHWRNRIPCVKGSRVHLRKQVSPVCYYRIYRAQIRLPRFFVTDYRPPRKLRVTVGLTAFNIWLLSDRALISEMCRPRRKCNGYFNFGVAILLQFLRRTRGDSRDATRAKTGMFDIPVVRACCKRRLDALIAPSFYVDNLFLNFMFTSSPR